MITLDLMSEANNSDLLEKSLRWDDLDQIEDNIDRQTILQHYAAKND